MVYSYRQDDEEELRSYLSIITYPIQLIVNMPVSIAKWTTETFASRRVLLEENLQRHNQQLLLMARLQKLEALEAENIRLRRLFNSSFKVSERVLIAEIMAVDMAPFSKQIVINKGSRQNIKPKQPVLDANGVMGQVIHVNPLSSSVMLITDPSHAIPVVISRNGLRAIAVGTGEANRMTLSHIPNNADIITGDSLVTSGLGERFPPGYPVGTVTHIIKNPDESYAQVYVEPTGNLESTREVLLVWPAETVTYSAPDATEDNPSPQSP